MRTALLALALAACGGKSEDSASSGDPLLVVASPPDGAWYDAGEPVPFEVRAKEDGGGALDVESAHWSTDGWSADGVSFTATDLPAGNLEITVEAVVEGATLTGSVSVTVWAER